MDWLELIGRIDNNNVDDLNLPRRLIDRLREDNIYGRVLGAWWPHRVVDPSWHIWARPCIIPHRPDGLFLMEARVPHSRGKFLRGNASLDSQRNHLQICRAIAQAAASLQQATGMPVVVMY